MEREKLLLLMQPGSQTPTCRPAPSTVCETHAFHRNPSPFTLRFLTLATKVSFAQITNIYLPEAAPHYSKQAGKNSRGLQ